ncbi:hypothetical protein [Streptomyces sp. NPDC051569]
MDIGMGALWRALTFVGRGIYTVLDIGNVIDGFRAMRDEIRKKKK